jgi:hypothetical protein
MRMHCMRMRLLARAVGLSFHVARRSGSPPHKLRATALVLPTPRPLCRPRGDQQQRARDPLQPLRRPGCDHPPHRRRALSAAPRYGAAGVLYVAGPVHGMLERRLDASLRGAPSSWLKHAALPEFGCPPMFLFLHCINMLNAGVQITYLCSQMAPTLQPKACDGVHTICEPIRPLCSPTDGQVRKPRCRRARARTANAFEMVAVQRPPPRMLSATRVSPKHATR